MARKIRKHALPGDIACCHGPGIKALNCCVIAAASLLNAAIHVYARCGDSYKWLKHSADEAKSGLHQHEYAYTSINILKQLKIFLIIGTW